jgi:5-methylcytosine-specific restriction endonuclease McrA
MTWTRCPHRNVRIVWTQYSGYGDKYAKRQLRQQCTDSSELVRGALKYALATKDTQELSREEPARAYRERQDYWNRQHEQRKREIEAAREPRRREYHEYLQTDAWAERRNLVLIRANCLCEGCRKAAAEQVHHLTYEHVGNAFLWELVAICRACHERFHDIYQHDF